MARNQNYGSGNIKKKKKKRESSIQTSLIYTMVIHNINSFVFFFLSLSTSLSSSKPQIKIIIGKKTKYLYKQQNRINPKKKKIVTKG